MTKIPDLRRALKGVSTGEVLIPILRTSLNDPRFDDFTIDVRGYATKKKDSGYFHPSTHSTWNVRQLALYRMAPELLTREPLPFTGTLSVTQGNFWHGFIQHVLEENGVLVDSEVRFQDETFKRSGYADGILNVGGKEIIFELKTINSNGISKLNTLEDVFKFKYQYWCQIQEYLDVFGMDEAIILFITPDYPFPMKEFRIVADEAHQEERRRTYEMALEIAATSKLPLSKLSLPCCGAPDRCQVAKLCG